MKKYVLSLVLLMLAPILRAAAIDQQNTPTETQEVRYSELPQSAPIAPDRFLTVIHDPQNDTIHTLTFQNGLLISNFSAPADQFTGKKDLKNPMTIRGVLRLQEKCIALMTRDTDDQRNNLIVLKILIQNGAGRINSFMTFTPIDGQILKIKDVVKKPGENLEFILLVLANDRLMIEQKLGINLKTLKIYNTSIEKCHVLEKPKDGEITFTYDGPGKLEASTECSICTNEITKENGRKLTCGHIFHTNCIAEWFKRGGTCPLCRR